MIFLLIKMSLILFVFCKIAKMRESVECENACCDDCVIKTVEWLLEDRIMDWRTVKPFTPVKVRDSEYDPWYDDYYFVRVIVVESKECFIVSTTDNVENPGDELAVFNQCKLY